MRGVDANMPSTGDPDAGSRLRGFHEIRILDAEQRIACTPGENLLRAMERLNLHLIPVGCRGGGCGVCRIRVRRGDYATRRMSRVHVSAADEAAGIALACCLMPQGDLEIEVLGSTTSNPSAVLKPLQD